ncbi:hypothetical protein [Micromonospora arborensis]|uniref:hypothetical protein n=1 Tax=Micromonospora arborensis TaxID=2116518 RepID=UPI0037172095
MMEKSDGIALAQVGRYVHEFASKATQLNDYRTGGRWWKLRVSADVAAAWANLGYLPERAAPLIAKGVTPETAGELNQVAQDIAGGPEQRAMQVVDGLVADGVVVDPIRVRQAQDPNDPQHTIVHITREED